MFRDAEPPVVQTPQYQWPTKLLLRPQGQTGTVRMVRLQDKPKPLVIMISEQPEADTSRIKLTLHSDKRSREAGDTQDASSVSGNDCSSTTEAGASSHGRELPEHERQVPRDRVEPEYERNAISSGADVKETSSGTSKEEPESSSTPGPESAPLTPAARVMAVLTRSRARDASSERWRRIRAHQEEDEYLSEIKPFRNGEVDSFSPRRLRKISKVADLFALDARGVLYRLARSTAEYCNNLRLLHASTTK
ncbi:unnamed protein product [Phytophthora fragariaefolia]|uniref:Unnamed protein product n=1 Tax=Phytophthora fragariaefolia TaxID=1490495 RepID=A0A9W6XMU0_9STRA|nr:unnamed protein product [Phytophthora fragariaefolia]